MTTNEFYKHICNLKNKFENRDLETYLLSLLKLAEQEKNQPLTPDLLLKLIENAFISDPKEFNSEWLSITDAPESLSIDKSKISDKNEIDYSISVLQFQISELHKMRGKQLDDEKRYFGIDSETGNIWYNFDPMTNLECGARCILDSDDEKEFIVTWQTLGELLEIGRVYE
ncbi:MAG: hypothetical protein WCY89_03570 [Flavobacteriaceae bacterium]